MSTLTEDDRKAFRSASIEDIMKAAHRERAEAQTKIPYTAIGRDDDDRVPVLRRVHTALDERVRAEPAAGPRRPSQLDHRPHRRGWRHRPHGR